MALQEIVLPSGIVALLFLLGLALLTIKRTRTCAWLPLSGAGALYMIFSNGLVATFLMSPLEYAYPSMRDPASHSEAKVIAVLTAYAAEDTDMPLSSQLNASSAFRVLEAANLYAERPDCRVMVTGSRVAAKLMAEQLLRLGVPPDKLVVDGDSPHTSDSADRIRALVGTGHVFLVTSAGHMRRAMGVLRKQGVEAIPVPTDYQLPKALRDASWTQSTIHLQASDLAVNEYLGLVWYRMRGKI